MYYGNSWTMGCKNVSVYWDRPCVTLSIDATMDLPGGLDGFLWILGRNTVSSDLNLSERFVYNLAYVFSSDSSLYAYIMYSIRSRIAMPPPLSAVVVVLCTSESSQRIIGCRMCLYTGPSHGWVKGGFRSDGLP